MCVCVRSFRMKSHGTRVSNNFPVRLLSKAGGTIGLNELVQHVESNLSNHSLRFDYVVWLLKGILSFVCVCVCVGVRGIKIDL